MTVIDERFLMRRLRSTSIAGVTAGVLASLLWLLQLPARLYPQFHPDLMDGVRASSSASRSAR